MHSLKVFGSLAFASTLNVHRTKLESRARKCVFLGYKNGMKGVVLYDIHSHSILISRNVIHHEHIFPYSNSNSINWDYHLHKDSIEHFQHNPVIHVPSQNIEPANDEHDNQHTIANDTLHHSNSDPETVENTDENNDTQHILDTHDTENCNTQSRPVRTKQTPHYLSDYVCNISDVSAVKSSSGTSKVIYPISNYDSLNFLSASHRVFASNISLIYEPKNYKEACLSEHWIKAMKSELDALDKNETWNIVDLPPHVKPIGNRWVFKVKHKADGTIERYKARLVAKGYNQIEGLDFFDTFSPVAKLTTVRTLLATAAINNWFLHQLDVNNAFLHRELKEDVYMTIPEGVTCHKPNQVCKLQNSLYGLKQASRKWYEKLTALLLHQGYTQSASDYSLFTLKTDIHFTAILVYVDDIILVGNSMSEFDRIKHILNETFNIKELGTLKYFLGLEVAHSKTGISLSQRKYCLDLLQESGMLGSKPAPTPLDPSVKLHADNGKAFDDIGTYRRLIGRLLYLNTTRPDITYATQQLSQFLHNPTMAHYHAACRDTISEKQSW